MRGPNPAVRPDDGRTNKPYFGKGFYVTFDAFRKPHGLYRARIKTAEKEIFVGSSRDFLQAVRLGVSAAHRERTLNWKAAVAWARRKGLDLSYDDAFLPGRYKVQKGYYVRRNGGPSRYEILVGPSVREAKMVGVEKTLRDAAILALRKSVGAPFYDEFSSVEWLRRQGLDELISMATTKNARK